MVHKVVLLACLDHHSPEAIQQVQLLLFQGRELLLQLQNFHCRSRVLSRLAEYRRHQMVKLILCDCLGFVAAQQNENILVRGGGGGGSGNGTSGGTGKGVSFQTPSNVKKLQVSSKSLTTGGVKTNNNGGGGSTTIRRRALGDISNKKSRCLLSVSPPVKPPSKVVAATPSQR